eukprot:3550740-Alexandrium_andersonii.AAC.1
MNGPPGQNKIQLIENQYRATAGIVRAPRAKRGGEKVKGSEAKELAGASQQVNTAKLESVRTRHANL